jgi:hypothetical protein
MFARHSIEPMVPIDTASRACRFRMWRWSIDQFDMRALVPAMHDLPAVTDSSLLVGGETCWAENAREDAKFDGNTFEVEGILRGRPPRFVHWMIAGLVLGG